MPLDVSSKFVQKVGDRVSARATMIADGKPATGKLMGYARVSTVEQRLDMQHDALVRAGVAAADIFTEKVSGASKRRPALALCMRALRPGDTLVVWRLDRLGRNLLDLLTKMQALHERGVHFRSLTESIDTGTAAERLIMHVVGAIAEFERQLTRERTTAGVRAHVERGGRHGRDLEIDLKAVEAVLRNGGTLSDAARAIGKSRTTVAYHYTAEDARRLARLGPLKKRKQR